MSITEFSHGLIAPTKSVPTIIDYSIDNSLIQSAYSLTSELWQTVIAIGHTPVQKTDLCDHGFTVDQINMYLHKLEGPNDMIIKAYFSYVYGLDRLIEETTSDPVITRSARIYAINKISETHCVMWGLNCTVMDRMYEIFGLVPVIYELNRIMINCFAEPNNCDGHNGYVEQYFHLCRKYGLNFRSCVPYKPLWIYRINKYFAKYY